MFAADKDNYIIFSAEILQMIPPAGNKFADCIIMYKVLWSAQIIIFFLKQPDKFFIFIFIFGGLGKEA